MATADSEITFSSTGLIAVGWATPNESYLRIVPATATAAELEAAEDILPPFDPPIFSSSLVAS